MSLRYVTYSLHKTLPIYVQYWRINELPLRELRIERENTTDLCVLPRMNAVPTLNWMRSFTPPGVISLLSGETSMHLFNQIEKVVGSDMMEMAIVDTYLPSHGDINVAQAIDKALGARNLTNLLPESNVTVNTLVHDWEEKPSSNPPVVTINATSNSSLLIAQVNGVEWLPITILTSRDYQELIWIPENFTVTYSGADNDTLSFLKSAESTGDWVAVVQNGYSSFRVIYDEKLTALLAQQLIRNHTALSPALRMELINDYFTCTLQSCGGLPYVPVELAMELTGYLEKETDWLVWEAFRILGDSEYVRRYYYFWDFVYQRFRIEGRKEALPLLKVYFLF